jgi:acyl-CoA reductase-like NAD-dependent aldehyde dehydrogenase
VTSTLTGVDPRTGEAVGSGVPEAGADEARAAATAAARAFRERPAPGTPGSFDDGVLLEGVAAGLDAVVDDLVEVAVRETGLEQGRLRGEVARTVNQLRAFAAARRDGLLADAIIDTARPDATPPRPDQRRVAVPLGPVAVFSASNFPFAFSTAGGDTASAFAVGCPVILKAHPAHPVTSHVTGQAVSAAVRAAGAPDEWFQLLQGAGIELGQALATADDVAAVAFTGSLPAGRALVDAAARRDVPIPVFAEMGSINPLVVTPAALQRRGGEIGQALAGAVLGSAGQLCTKPNLVLAVEGPGLDDLVTALADALRLAGELVMLTTRLRDGFAESWRHLLQDAQVQELVPAVPAPREGAWQSAGLATVSAAALLQRPDLMEEHFGPGTVIAVARDAEELERLTATLPGTLTATLHAEAEDERDPAVRRLATALAARAGRMIWNGLPTGVTVGHATVHGGPYPATSMPATTSVGTTAARRFQRAVGYQAWPDALLPAELQDANPLGIVRLLDGTFTREPVVRAQPST